MKYVFLLFSFLLNFCVGNDLSGDDISGDDLSAILTNLTSGYDKRIRPNYGGIPVTVEVSLFILSIIELSEKNMDFTFNMYFRQRWNDPRLAFQQKSSLKGILVDAEFIKSIWVPDTFFVNEKESHIHQGVTRLMYDGYILRSVRMTVKASCSYDLQHFPMDSQLCTLEIESYGHTNDDLRYEWMNGENSVRLSPGVALPEFSVLGHRNRLFEVNLPSGTYPRLLCDVMFERNIGLYVIQAYLPMALMVMVSWLALWLKEVSTRVGLCMISILTIMNIMISLHSSMPRISYFTAFHIYFYVSFLSICATLIESVCVSFITTQKQEMETKDQDQDHHPSVRCTGEAIQLIPLKEKAEKGKKVLCGLNPGYLDLMSRVGFPILFLVFNIFYTSIYCVIANHNITKVDDLVYLEDSILS